MSFYLSVLLTESHGLDSNFADYKVRVPKLPVLQRGIKVLLGIRGTVALMIELLCRRKLLALLLPGDHGAAAAGWLQRKAVEHKAMATDQNFLLRC